jgi:tetratricopeptide (TPR) repeat protein
VSRLRVPGPTATAGPGRVLLAVAWWVALALGLAATPPARAEAPQTTAGANPESVRLYQQGLRHFEARRYDEAIADFEAAYLVTPAAGLLYNMAQAHRLAGNCAKALSYYEQFMAAAPAAKMRERTAAQIAEMQRCLIAAAPPPVTVPDPPAPTPPAPDPPAPAPAALPRTLATPAGTHVAAAPPARRSWRRPAGVGLGVTSLALAIGGGYFGWRSNDAATDVARLMNTGGKWDAAATAREHNGLRDEKLALGFGAGALVAAAVAAWLLLASREDGSP